MEACDCALHWEWGLTYEHATGTNAWMAGKQSRARGVKVRCAACNTRDQCGGMRERGLRGGRGVTHLQEERGGNRGATSGVQTAKEEGKKDHNGAGKQIQLQGEPQRQGQV